jgi:hypothetical protein
MTLTVVEHARTVVGKLRKVVLDITDSDGSGGAVDTQFSYLESADIVNRTSVAREPTLTYSHDSGSITIGSEGNASDVYQLTAYGL